MLNVIESASICHLYSENYSGLLFKEMVTFDVLVKLICQQYVKVGDSKFYNRLRPSLITLLRCPALPNTLLELIPCSDVSLFSILLHTDQLIYFVSYFQLL